MTLKDILLKYNLDSVNIYYRTIINLPDEGDVDIFAGACRFDNHQLIPLDGDSYSLDDPITRYEVDPINQVLTVWYESE